MMSLFQSEKQLSVAVYCDYQNVPLSQEQAILLTEFAQTQGNLIFAKVYLNFNEPNQNKQSKNFESLGFQCVNVPCFLKNSADNQLKSDLMDDVQNDDLGLELVIIVSGDGDFLSGVKMSQRQGKKVIVLARKGNIKQKLLEQADECHFIEDLETLLCQEYSVKAIEAQVEVDLVKPYIDYHQAILYLKEAIKVAVKNGKIAALGYINQLMLKLFPDYQNVSDIQTIDGNKFKKFSQFIDAVVQDGKIQRINQYLQLID